MKKIKILFFIFLLLYNNYSFAISSTDNVQEKIFNQKYENDRNDEKQKTIEILKINNLKNSLLLPGNDSFIYNYISWDRNILVTNKDFEFVEWNNIKRIIFTKYYNINWDDYNFFKNKKWFIVNKSWTNDFIFVENYDFETKIPYSQISKYTKWYITSNSKYLLENWVYYGYIFSNSLYFPDEAYWLYTKLTWDLSNFIFYKTEDWKYSFIKDYKKVKLISSNIIYWLIWKYNFLKELADDVSSPWFKDRNVEDYDESFKKLKKEVLNLTNWLEKDEKIKKIYSWILENISYTEKISFTDKKIFSWIDTYKNKSWVCSWYTILFLYMLSFAWIDDVDVIKWDVIDAQDFPTIWHAWVKIWNYYYDPTFDDPVWLNRAKKFEEYKYYKLSKDIFYTNRYDYWFTPASLKKTTLDYRKNIVKKNISSLVSKYKNSWLVLLKPYIFREKNWLSYNEKITIEKLKKIKTFYKVTNNYLEINSQKKFITNVSYLPITDSNLELALEQFNYDIDNYYFLERNLWNWKMELRMAISLKF